VLLTEQSDETGQAKKSSRREGELEPNLQNIFGAVPRGEHRRGLARVLSRFARFEARDVLVAMVMNARGRVEGERDVAEATRARSRKGSDGSARANC